MSGYRIGRLGGRFVLVFESGGKHRRFRLNAKDASEAHRLAPGIFAELTRPAGTKVKDLWQAYMLDKSGRPVTGTMVHTWKALQQRFGDMDGQSITIADCRAHMAERRKNRIMDGTLLTELGHLRMVLKWAEKHKLIDRAPHIERPSKPKPKEHYLTKGQARALIEAASIPHIRLYIILALGTGARNAALLDLKWDRCDFEREIIDLRNPGIITPHKGRAVVPMTRTVKAALLAAQQGAMSDYVIEWAGKQVASVKRGIRLAAKRAGVGHVSPHIFRHSAAVHMAEEGVSMPEISQYLGHSNTQITERIYARYSPAYLRKAAAALEYDDLSSMNQKVTMLRRIK
jgi:integrase